MFGLQINKLASFAAIALLLNSNLTNAETLRIASWNIEWLDTTPEQRQQERTPADYRTLKSYAEKLDADVIAFQEVADRASAARLFPTDEYQIIMSSRDNDQKVGFAIRKTLTVQQLPELKALDLHSKQSLRYGLPIKVTTTDQQSLTLLNVHLKAGCYNNKAEKQSKRRKSCQQLQRQARLIHNWAEQQGNTSFAILGDFNRQLKNSQDNIWKTLSPAGLNTTGNNDSSQCYSRRYDKKKRNWKLHSYPKYIDHILLSDAAEKYFESGSFRQHTYRKKDVLENYLSDHCAVSVRLKM